MNEPEVPFDQPWQARAFALTLAVVDGLGLEYEDFRQRLIAAIAAQPEAPYYESWVAALEALLRAHGIEAPMIGVEIVGARSSS